MLTDYIERENAPCQYSLQELEKVLRESLDDEKNNKVHSHAEVQKMIMSKINSWKANE